MLATRIQSPRKPVASHKFTDAEFAAMSFAARNAATQAWLDHAQGLKPETTKNRDFRETCGQGPSYDLLSNRSENNSEDFDPRDHDPDPDVRRRAGEGEDMTGGGEVSEETGDEFIAIDTPSGGLGFATANPFCTDTRVARGGPARNRDRNAWNAILALYPLNGRDRDVLVASAQCGAGASKQIGILVGLSGRRVRTLQDKLLKWALRNLTSADLRSHRDDPTTTEIVTRRLPSRAGRKPKAAALTIPRVLVLVPHEAGPAKPRRDYKPRKPRGRFVDPAQVDMFLEVAA